MNTSIHEQLFYKLHKRYPHVWNTLSTNQLKHFVYISCWFCIFLAILFLPSYYQIEPIFCNVLEPIWKLIIVSIICLHYLNYDCYWSRQLLVYWTELINHYSLYTCIIIPNTDFLKLKICSPVFRLKNLTSTNLTIMAAAKHIQLNMSVTLNTVSIRHQGRFHPVVLHQTVHV